MDDVQALLSGIRDNGGDDYANGWDWDQQRGRRVPLRDQKNLRNAKHEEEAEEGDCVKG
jgi:hypothetical protein